MDDVDRHGGHGGGSGADAGDGGGGAAVGAGPAPPIQPPGRTDLTASTPALRAEYYMRWCPVDAIFLLLRAYVPTLRLEFAGTMVNGPQGRQVRRNLTVRDAGGLRQLLLHYDRVDAGAAYAATKSALNVARDTPEETRLVLDIDAGDVDRAGVCECDAQCVCDACWPRVVDTARQAYRILTEVLLFKGVLCTVSGRRGVHLYVTDAWAYTLSADARTAIVNVLRAHGVQVDEAVTKHMSHLVGLPFTVHPATQRVGICLDLAPPTKPTAAAARLAPNSTSNDLHFGRADLLPWSKLPTLADVMCNMVDGRPAWLDESWRLLYRLKLAPPAPAQF